MKRNLEEELSEFVKRIQDISSEHCPDWLTSNSYSVGIMPGHNLDLLQISLDYRVNRTEFLKTEVPDILKDPSKPDLRAVK